MPITDDSLNELRNMKSWQYDDVCDPDDHICYLKHDKQEPEDVLKMIEDINIFVYSAYFVFAKITGKEETINMGNASKRKFLKLAKSVLGDPNCGLDTIIREGVDTIFSQEKLKNINGATLLLLLLKKINFKEQQQDNEIITDLKSIQDNNAAMEVLKIHAMNAPVSMETFCDAYNKIQNEENKNFLIKRYFEEIYLYGEGKGNDFGKYPTKLFSDNEKYGSFTRPHYNVFEQVIDEYVNGKQKNENDIINFKKQDYLIVKNIINVSNEIIDETVTKLGERAEFLKNLKEYLVKISVSVLNNTHEIYKPHDIKKGDKVFVIDSDYTDNSDGYYWFRPNATKDHIQKYFYYTQGPDTTIPAGEIVGKSTKVILCKSKTVGFLGGCQPPNDFSFVRNKSHNNTKGGKRKSSKKSKKSKRKTKQKKAKTRTKRRKY